MSKVTYGTIIQLDIYKSSTLFERLCSKAPMYRSGLYDETGCARMLIGLAVSCSLSLPLLFSWFIVATLMLSFDYEWVLEGESCSVSCANSARLCSLDDVWDSLWCDVRPLMMLKWLVWTSHNGAMEAELKLSRLSQKLSRSWPELDTQEDWKLKLTWTAVFPQKLFTFGDHICDIFVTYLW